MFTPDISTAPADYRVLLVDDDPDMLSLLARWLSTAGYPLRVASDGREALDAIELECPDFIITDWMMPRVDGLELCRRTREMILPHYAYILFLTVKSNPADAIDGLENGADDYLHKPITRGELLARMKSGIRVLEQERRLRWMAHSDPLTGLLNRRTFYEDLTKACHRAKRSHSPLSCVMTDLDCFKRINDVYGHPAGDSVLRCAAELLIDNSRAADLICRYGGEEFCVMLPDTDAEGAAVWAERTRRRLAALRFPFGEQGERITGSFGIAQCCDETQNAEQLIDLADQALLQAKRLGRNCIVCHGDFADRVEDNAPLVVP